MRKKLKNSMLILLGCVAALVLSTSGVFALGGISDHSYEQSITECSNLLIPDNTEVNTNLDKEHNLLHASWYDETQGKDVFVTIKYKDKTCSQNKNVKHKIQHILEADAIQQEKICNKMKEDINNNVKEINGKKVNIEAGKKYLTEWCTP
jgi:hypothetical protein